MEEIKISKLPKYAKEHCKRYGYEMSSNRNYIKIWTNYAKTWFIDFYARQLTD